MLVLRVGEGDGRDTNGHRRVSRCFGLEPARRNACATRFDIGVTTIFWSGGHAVCAQGDHAAP
ncbi:MULTISPECIES: hypothetical protein [unclassified Sphingobium]|uniref:hypothetical protein n=1 Tax=unclassified Sphingobium TaxID=2611147 RepID=UPI00222435AF|nr:MULTISPECIES: hypothetical protein [unclassified Sphingobium]MCW2411127.1 hypothetical protein [Sphingobium sp. B8D3D]MCW2416581.1 hypothetical protein [Sphingobium sp. B8D3A]